MLIEKLIVAVLGALVGSLFGRLIVNPGWLGHIAFLTIGALAFSLLDWLWRTPSGSADHPGGVASKTKERS